MSPPEAHRRAPPPAVGRAARAEDVPGVIACLASAFSEDPLWGHWAFPDPSARGEQLRGMMRFWVAAGVQRSSVRIAERAEAVAVWVPPGEPEMSEGQEAALGAFISQAAGERGAEILSVFGEFDAHHPHDRAHHYLSLLGTHRDSAGRGLGMALLREELQRIDAEPLPSYLESTNPANLPRYEALGFRRTGEFGPPGGPRIATMWRPAR